MICRVEKPYQGTITKPLVESQTISGTDAGAGKRSASLNTAHDAVTS